MSKKAVVFVITLLIVIAGYLLISKGDQAAVSNQTKGDRQGVELSKEETGKYTIGNQSSIYYIVNKKRGLPSTFVPQNLVTVGGEQLRADTANSTNNLVAAARKDGISFRIISGYRSYDYQARLYNDYVRADGRQKADTYSARAGYSEHQTGLAVDVGTGICDLQKCFGETKAGKWLAEHAHDYGFIIRYENDKENSTGYQYEPWHIRYVGNDLAGKIYKSGKTMEQFFGLPAATSY
jgi:D-alanyl-D-alanine carboxypeptidase